MSVIGGQNLITLNGLVYALDFGNQKSYVSGSNSAFNLVYSTTTSSLNSYNSGQKGVVIDNSYQFNVPGDAYVSSSYFLTQALTFLDTASEYTVTAVVEPKAGNYSGEPRYLASNLTAAGRTWGITYGTSGFTQYGINDGSVSIYSRQYPVGTSRQHVTYRYKSGSFDFFVNGVPVSASAINPSTFFRYQYGGGLTIGSPLDYLSPTPNGYAFSGSLGLFYVYNRALSSDEIYSNYLVAAERYGFPTPTKPYSLDENAYLFLQSAGITDPIITGSINTFVLGLKSASLWDKMIAIYPFVGTGSVGTNLTGSQRWNLKEPSLVTYPLSFTGSWNGSVSGSTPSGSNTNITLGGITPSTYYPNYSSSNAHISILSYDTPVSSSALMGTGMTKDLAVSTLAGDYGTPAAAYSVRKVRTAYSGALMDVRRDYDNTTGSVGYVSNGDLDTGSLLDFVLPGRTTLPGTYSGLAAAYSLRKVSASYSGNSIDVRRSSDNTTGSIGFDANGNLDTGSLTTFVLQQKNILLDSENFSTSAWQKANALITTASIAAPDSTLTGNKWEKTNVGGYTELNFGAIGFSNTFGNTSISVYAKSGSINAFRSYGTSGAGGETIYDLSTGTIVSGTGSIEDVGDGWYRCSGPANNRSIDLYFTGSVGDYIYIWGAQQTTGSTALLPYVKNTSTFNLTPFHGYVAQWYDQSGNNRHATQTTTGSQPLIVSSGSLVTDNNKPALDFDGVDDFYNFPNLTPTSNDSIFLLGRRKTNSSNGIFLSNTGSSFPYRVGHSNNDEYQYQAAGYKLYGLSNTANQDLISAFANGYGSTGFLLYVNSIQPTLLEYGTSGYQTPWNSIGSSNAFSNAYTQEILIYTSSQIDNRPLIENNINNYYSIYTSSNAGYVARWYDQSGNNNHAVMTVTSSQPQIVSSGSTISVNQRSAIYNNSTSLNLTTPLSLGDFTILWVTKRSVTVGSSGVVLGTITAQESAMGDNTDGGGTPTAYRSAFFIGTSTSNSSTGGTENLQHLSYLNRRNGTQAVGQLNNSDNSYNNSVTSANFRVEAISNYRSDYNFLGYYQEIIIYSSDKSTFREPISYGINNYYNIYPQTSSFATSSFTIYATTSSISASINNDIQSGIASSGPLGFITVSRTGSNSLTIARNGVTSSFTVPASGALSTGIYLGAINNNGIAVGSSPYNISFASVGTGLTNSDVQTLNRLVYQANYYRDPSIVTNGLTLNLDSQNPSSYPGSDNTWFDLSGNNYNATLSNGFSYSNNTGGTLVFDGADNTGGRGVVTNYYPVFSGDFTINLWVNFSTYKQYQNIISSANDGNAAQGFWLEFGSGRGFTMYSNSSDIVQDNLVSLTTLSTNTWHNVCVTRVGTGSNNIKLYVDNVLCGQNTSNVTVGNINQNLEIARYSKNATNFFFQGSIARIQIYNSRGFSSDEVSQNFNATRGRFGV
jgi:hypothetical protein